VSSAAEAAVAVVIPAFRAAHAIGDVVSRALAAVPGATVLVVDDGSGDETAARARAAGADVARHETNRGKGAALATGLAAAVARAGICHVVTLDADGQHPPERIGDLLEPLRRGEADLVIGARRRDAAVMPAGRRLTNWLSSTLVTRALGQGVPDSQSGFRAMSRSVAERVRPTSARYEYETEFLFLAGAEGFRIRAVEIPTVYGGMPSHFRHVGDTARIARVFLRHWRRLV